MTKLTKTLLGLAVTGIGCGLLFVTGAITVQDNVFWYVSLPAGAIFFGLFLISLALAKESARFDEAERAALAKIATPDTNCCAKDGSRDCGKNIGKPAFASVH